VPTSRELRKLRGYERVTSDLRRALFVPGAEAEGFELYTLLGNPDDRPALAGLVSLLGSQVFDAGRFEFRNGTPTPINMFLWDLLLGRLATELARECDSKNPHLAFATLTAEMQQALTTACTWPAENSTLALGNIWFTLMGHRAPTSEYVAWFRFFAEPDAPYRDAAPKVWVRDAIRGVLMNPYFLLD
jgi:hypothetical protein